MKIPFLLILATALVVGCKDASQSTAEPSVAAEHAVQAREEPSVPAAELNSQLAAKITFGTAEEVRQLLAKGATPHATDRYGLPVLFLAAQRGEAGVVRELVQAGADVNAKIGTAYNTDGQGYAGTSDGTPLGYAASKGRLEVMEVLKNAGADVDGQGPGGTTPLMRAAEGGELEALKWLLRNGATAGRDKALAQLKTVGNPSPKYVEMMRLLQAAPR